MIDELPRMTDEEIRETKWYYTVELRPGVFTADQFKFINILPARMLLQKIDLSGLDVLDIGVMEGYFPMLMDRAGAKVTAYDRIDLTPRIETVKSVYRTEFDYQTGEFFHRFAERSREAGRSYDFILFSGVLYHVIDPTLFVYHVRTLLRDGGTMLLETAAVVDDDAALLLNEAGRFFGGTNYYLPTTGWLDYYLRLLGFQIVDADYVDPLQREQTFGGKRVTRVAMTCRLRGEPLLEEGDAWAPKGYYQPELAEYGKPVGGAAPDFSGRIECRDFDEKLYREVSGVRSLRLTEVLRETKGLVRDQARCVMKLEDRLGSFDDPRIAPPPPGPDGLEKPPLARPA